MLRGQLDSCSLKGGALSLAQSSNGFRLNGLKRMV